MKIRVVKISRRRSGSETRQVRIVESASFSIGRSTDSALVINDLSVPLRHSSLRLKEDGVHLECDDATEVLVDGVVAESASLAPGQIVRISNVELRIVEPVGDEDLAIEIRDMCRRGDEGAELALRTRMGVERPWLGRRGLSWLAVVLIVCVFLLRPLLTGSGEAAWNTGPISSAHSFIADDCRACHGEFERVRDESCLECHSQIGEHASVALELVSHTGSRCAGCHLEHNGNSGPSDIGEERCASCHEKISEVHAATRLGNASDFEENHPEFSLALASDPARDPRGRLAQSRKLVEKSGLRFSHLRHVGQAVLEAGGQMRNLRCDACHRLDRAGMYMEPVSFEVDCQDCHRLTFDGEFPDTEASHGSPLALRAQLRGLYSERALKGEVQSPEVPSFIRFLRPGRELEKDEVRAVYTWVEEQVTTAEERLIGENGECARCHEILRGEASDGGFDVARVEVTEVWLPSSTFWHKTHQVFPCRDCHARAAIYDASGETTAERPDWSLEDARPYALWSPEELLARHGDLPSESSEDVLIPGIEECRTCHGGGDASPPLVASDCALCHSFHRDEYGSMARNSREPRRMRGSRIRFADRQAVNP